MNTPVILFSIIFPFIVTHANEFNNVEALSVESKLVLSKLKGLQSEISHIFNSVDDEKQKEMIEEMLNSEEQANESEAETQIYSNNMDSLTEASRQILARLHEILTEKQTLIEGVKDESERHQVIVQNLINELEAMREDLQKTV